MSSTRIHPSSHCILVSMTFDKKLATSLRRAINALAYITVAQTDFMSDFTRFQRENALHVGQVLQHKRLPTDVEHIRGPMATVTATATALACPLPRGSHDPFYGVLRNSAQSTILGFCMLIIEPRRFSLIARARLTEQGVFGVSTLEPGGGA